MRPTMRLTRFLTLLAVLAVVVMVLMDAAEAGREGRRNGGGGGAGGGGGGGGGRRGGRGGSRGARKLPMRGLEKCLCGRSSEVPGCTTCFEHVKSNTSSGWTVFGNCLDQIPDIPPPGPNSSCTPPSPPRRHR